MADPTYEQREKITDRMAHAAGTIKQCKRVKDEGIKGLIIFSETNQLEIMATGAAEQLLTFFENQTKEYLDEQIELLSKLLTQDILKKE
jgi:hypothetical protein